MSEIGNCGKSHLLPVFPDRPFQDLQTGKANKKVAPDGRSTTENGQEGDTLSMCHTIGSIDINELPSELPVWNGVSESKDNNQYVSLDFGDSSANR